jgi:hypothetical protein
MALLYSSAVRLSPVTPYVRRGRELPPSAVSDFGSEMEADLVSPPNVSPPLSVPCLGTPAGRRRLHRHVHEQGGRLARQVCPAAGDDVAPGTCRPRRDRLLASC